MLAQLRYLLLQVRNPDDPMLRQETECFARALETTEDRIERFDLLAGRPQRVQLARADVVLLGGSGHYSVTDDAPWLDRALAALREIHAIRKPTFASCWGFQAMARALGGKVLKDVSRAEIGTHALALTEEGKRDTLFGGLPETFLAQMGHEDLVVELPPDAVRMASSARVINQAYRFADRPIYCTQFHPELRREDLFARVRTYPEYLTKITGETIEQFCDSLQETPEAYSLLGRFVASHFGDARDRRPAGAQAGDGGDAHARR